MHPLSLENDLVLKLTSNISNNDVLKKKTSKLI